MVLIQFAAFTVQAPTTTALNRQTRSYPSHSLELELELRGSNRRKARRRDRNCAPTETGKAA